MRATLVAAAVVLSACTAASDPAPKQQSGTGAAVATEPSKSDESPRRVAVGVLVGSRLAEVRRSLAQRGLDVVVEERRTCRGLNGVVLRQGPRPFARHPADDPVRLIVAYEPFNAWCIPQTAGPARRLLNWARGDGPPPRFADRVRIMQGNRVVTVLPAGDAIDLGRWTMPAGYAERAELNALEWLAQQPRVAGRDVPPYFCPERTTEPPRDLANRLRWSSTLVNRAARACMELGAVQVWADNELRIEAVNLLLGSP